MLFNLISIIFIYLSYISIILSLNTYETNDITWWRSTSDFIPIHSTNYSTLQLRDALYMEFDIILNGPIPSNGKWQNIFRIGFPSSDSGGCYEHNSRYPSLWMFPNSNKWHFSISERNGCAKRWRNKPDAIIGTKYHIIIHYNNSHTFISLNNITYIDEPRGPTQSDLIGRIMYVWISTERSDQIPNANVTISNIIIISYWYNETFPLIPTISPTNIHTKYPTIIPSNTPTNMPTNNPSESIENPTLTPTSIVSMSPTQMLINATLYIDEYVIFGLKMENNSHYIIIMLFGGCFLGLIIGLLFFHCVCKKCFWKTEYKKHNKKKQNKYKNVNKNSKIDKMDEKEDEENENMDTGMNLFDENNESTDDESYSTDDDTCCSVYISL